jgi:hypothetical protein
VHLSAITDKRFNVLALIAESDTNHLFVSSLKLGLHRSLCLIKLRYQFPGINVEKVQRLREIGMLEWIYHI